MINGFGTTFDLLKQKLCGIETEQNNNNPLAELKR